MSNIDLRLGDCMEIMKDMIKNNIKVDAIICDLPYGTTACSWDSVIPIYEMFNILYQLRKDEHTPIVLFGSQPFTSKLVNTNIIHFEGFKYEWIYSKVVGSNFTQAKYMPIKEHENILVFGQKGNKTNYYPIMQSRADGGKKRLKTPYFTNSKEGGDVVGNINRNNAGKEYSELRFPSSVQQFNNREKDARGMHPTQKPISLMEYLVKTYSKENDTILDFAMGSGTTGVACINTNRNFIGIEIDDKYYNIAEERIKNSIGLFGE